MRSSLLRILPRGRRRFAAILAGATVFALAAGGAILGATAASADTTGGTTSGTSGTYVVALWKSDDPANLFPQTLVKTQTVALSSVDTPQDTAAALATFDNSLPASCGAQYQVDLYTAEPASKTLFNADSPQSWPNNQYQTWYSKVITSTKTACPPASPKLDAMASGCPAQGGPASLTGTVTGTSGESYRVDLLQSGSTTPLATQTVAGSGSFDFGTRGGGTYSVTVTDTAHPDLTVTQQVVVPSCGSVKDFSVDVTPCTTVGGNAVITITSSDFGTDTYQLKDSAGNIGGPFTASGDTHSIPVPSSTSAQQLTDLQLVDVTTGQATGLGDRTIEPCPSLPTPKVAIAAAACTQAGQATRDVTVTYSDLVTGRTYVPVVDGVDQPSFDQGQGSTHPLTIKDVTPGSHTYGIYDQAVKTVAASVTQDISACPTTPRVSVDAAACTTPTVDGSGTTAITVTASNLTIGRSYTVALTSGTPATTVASTTLTDVGATTEPASFPSAPVGATYIVTVTDTAFAATGSSLPVVVNKCPQVAALTIECVSNTLNIGTTDLLTGHLYTVTFERQNIDGVTYTTVKNAPVTASSAGAMYTPVGAGQTYRVTLTDNTANTQNDQQVIPIQDNCITPTTPTGKVDAFSITAQLAHTGVDAMPFLGLAGGFVIAGAGLVGFAAYRRHKEVRD